MLNNFQSHLNLIQLLKTFQIHFNHNFPNIKEEKLLVACSGGLDSVVLVHLMHSLNFEIGLAHCNFSLRGKESDGDEMFVVGLARSLEIPVFAETFNTKAFAENQGVSTQMAARTLRYNWFEDILKNFKYDYLLTAHHLDDDFETFFINLSRGTGIAGLSGIPAINGNILRPLLPFSRDEILNYAEKNKLKWREDSSNQQSDYLRNKLRMKVLPLYKETNPSLLKNFKKTQNNLNSSKALIEDYMSLIYNLAVSEDVGLYRINIQKLKELPNTEALLYQLLNSFGFTEWADVASLLNAQTGKQIFSKTHRLLKNRNELLLTTIDSNDPNLEFLVSKNGIEFPINLRVESVEHIDSSGKDHIYVDADKLKFPLKIRKWNEGDSFQPFGLIGNKKVSKFFKDEKISQIQKDRIWLLLSEKKIVWIIKYRMDDRFKITQNTEHIIRISYLGS